MTPSRVRAPIIALPNKISDSAAAILIGVRVVAVARKDHMARSRLGPIPDDHFENDHGPPPKNVPPLSKEWLEWIEKVKAERDKYQPGDVVGGY